MADPTQDELRLLMNSLGFYPSDETIRQLITQNDVDGDKQIDYEEFVQMAKSSRGKKKFFQRSRQRQVKHAK